MDKLLTIIILENIGITDTKNINNKQIEVLHANKDNLLEIIKSATTKYISFINYDDSVTDNYVDKILHKIREQDFDCCYIGYDIDYDFKRESLMIEDQDVYLKYKPYQDEYIWNYVYTKDKLIGTLITKDVDVDKYFTNTTYIKDIIYHHHNKGFIFNNWYLINRKETAYYKNILYVGDYCNGIFNGYVTWIINLEKAYPNYEVIILYDHMPKETINRFSLNYKCIEYHNNINYVGDKLLCTYSTFFYPKNIYSLEESIMFIHGIMSDYKNAAKYKDKLYDRYIAVSKIASIKARGYFNSNNIEYILNPYVVDSKIKPELKLISTLRNDPIKRMDRMEIMANILDQLDIPYTWNVFTDKKEETTSKGLIYRERTTDVLSYVKDSDYLVLLSDSEAFSYSALEALTVGTKVIVTPLPVYDELEIKDKENGYIIPFNYFDSENKDKLIEKIKEIYLNKDKSFTYNYDVSKYKAYEEVFKK
jgi:hypothetical protein